MRTHLTASVAFVSLAVSAASVCACSSSSSSPAAASSTDGGMDDATRDASSPAVDASGAENVGDIYVISEFGGDAGGAYSAGAFFSLHPAADPTLVSSRTVGPCVIDTFGDGAPPTDTAASAGALHITGGATTITMTPSAAAEYTSVDETSTLWAGGETLTVTADGQDVPAFSTSIVAPSRVTLTTPAVTASDLSVPRNAPFTATWTGATSGAVVLYFDATSATNAYSATCTFAASAGTGEVPAAAFADFPAGSGSFDFYVLSDTTTMPNATWAVHFAATSGLVTADGAGATGSTTYP